MQAIRIHNANDNLPATKVVKTRNVFIVFVPIKLGPCRSGNFSCATDSALEHVIVVGVMVEEMQGFFGNNTWTTCRCKTPASRTGQKDHDPDEAVDLRHVCLPRNPWVYIGKNDRPTSVDYHNVKENKSSVCEPLYYRRSFLSANFAEYRPNLFWERVPQKESNRGSFWIRHDTIIHARNQ